MSYQHRCDHKNRKGPQQSHVHPFCTDNIHLQKPFDGVFGSHFSNPKGFPKENGSQNASNHWELLGVVFSRPNAII